LRVIARESGRSSNHVIFDWVTTSGRRGYRITRFRVA